MTGDIPKNQIPFTDKQVMSQVRSALRKVWTATTKRDFIVKNRKIYTGLGRFKWGVVCRNSECRRLMGMTEKQKIKLKSGRLSKKPKLIYNIDHVDGISSFTKWEDLGQFADDLFNGPMRVLCYWCHSDVTEAQNKERKNGQKNN